VFSFFIYGSAWSKINFHSFIHSLSVWAPSVMVLTLEIRIQCISRPTRDSAKSISRTVPQSVGLWRVTLAVMYTEKQKLVGKKRVRKSFTGWLSISVQPRLSTCSRRRRALQHGQPLILLLRVTDLDGSTISQLVSTPVKCNATDEHLGNIRLAAWSTLYTWYLDLVRHRY